MTADSDFAARWRSGEPLAELARAAGVRPDSLRRRARREGWGPREDAGSAPRPPADPAPLLLTRLAASLSAAADSLESGPPQTPADLRALNDLIRAHRRAALTALESARRLSPSGASPADGSSLLDLAAARSDVLGRLARLEGS